MFMSQAWKRDPSHPVPTSPSPDVFSSNLLSPCQSKIGHPLTSPPAPADNLLPLSVAWLNPGCQSAVERSARSSALSAGDRLFGIYPWLLCLSLHLQPFMAVKSSLSSLILFLPSLPPSPFSSTHSTILPLPPPLPPSMLLIPSS
ncbi:hypothetical protein CgunFtcFv8_010815 [Champsocephalus gunnari]|uniref:Uncharacterized protein n=1 Tax=Champsocephalus gunnari TaxID=52237 RepID=A0AAN8DWF9_CHAGU|nr:hypothetical protein CgunFtcFv8_010815 [Champsocephalus gunnari]